MSKKGHFINNIILVAPHDSVVTIRPQRSLTSTSSGHKTPYAAKICHKQQISSSSSSSYAFVSNKSGCKIEHKTSTTTTSSSTTKMVRIKPSGSQNTGNKPIIIKPSGGGGSNVTASVKKSSDHRKVASKNESKCSSTVRVKDKQGYTEYHKSERLTRVDYGSKKLGSANK